MKRIYTDVSHFRSPYASVPFQGLGQEWPAGRNYYDVSNYRAPYDDGYFQNNTLFGLGMDPTPPGMTAPPPQPPRTTPTWMIAAGIVGAVVLGGVALLALKGETRPGGAGVGH